MKAMDESQLAAKSGTIQMVIVSDAVEICGKTALCLDLCLPALWTGLRGPGPPGEDTLHPQLNSDDTF